MTPSRADHSTPAAGTRRDIRQDTRRPTTPLAALALSACTLACASFGTAAQAEPRALGGSYHGPRGVAAMPVARMAPGGHGGADRGRHRGVDRWVDRGVHGGYPGGHRGGHGYHGWGGLALGLGIGALVFARPWEPVVIERQTYHDPYPPPPPPGPPPAAQSAPQPVPPAPNAPGRPPEPIVYPSQGQSPERLEADRQACNRWATTQPSAMADASVFHRATIACLEGRGYTVR